MNIVNCADFFCVHRCELYSFILVLFWSWLLMIFGKSRMGGKFMGLFRFLFGLIYRHLGGLRLFERTYGNRESCS